MKAAQVVPFGTALTRSFNVAGIVANFGSTMVPTAGNDHDDVDDMADDLADEESV